MLDTAGKIWWKFQEFLKRLNTLEDGTEETKRQVGYLQEEIKILTKGVGHNEKIQTYHTAKIAELEGRVSQLESENRGAKISAGKAKAKAARLEAQIKQQFN